jgi:hypothetical protein
VVNATLPPELAEPDTTRSALSLCVVDFVQPVGAAVWANNITVPDGKASTFAVAAGKVRVLVPATDGTANVIAPEVAPLILNVPVTF